MKSFKEFNEETLRQMSGRTYVGKKGDCYEAAFNWILSLDPDLAQNAKLCHGMVTGQGVLLGKKFGHAWGELGDVVIDNSNRKQLVMRKEKYYELGKIDESKLFCYPGFKSIGRASKAGHYGPWDMTGATVAVPSDGEMTEEIPERTNAIGKRRVRVSRTLLSALKKA